MKKLLFCALMAIMGLSFLSSCENDGGGMSKSELVGTWYFEYSYNTTPNYPTRYQYSTITFNSDKSGNYVFESTTGKYATASFTWKKSGNTVKCSGIMVSTTASECGEWNPTFTISGNKLVHGSREYYKR